MVSLFATEPPRRPGDTARGCMDLVANVFMITLALVLFTGTALCWAAYLLPTEGGR